MIEIEYNQIIVKKWLIVGLVEDNDCVGKREQSIPIATCVYDSENNFVI